MNDEIVKIMKDLIDRYEQQNADNQIIDEYIKNQEIRLASMLCLKNTKPLKIVDDK